MRKERDVLLSWVRLTLEDPVETEQKDDGTVHYIRPIEERGGKYLRVVVNPDAIPWRIVTLFFDRRLKEVAMRLKVDHKMMPCIFDSASQLLLVLRKYSRA